MRAWAGPFVSNSNYAVSLKRVAKRELSGQRHAKIVRVPGKSAKNLADLRLCDLFDNPARALLSAEDRKTVVIW